MSNVAVDIEADLSKTDIPSDNYAEEFQMMQEYMEDEATNWQLNGAIITFTINTGAKEESMHWGSEGMDYPGFGGPDVILDTIIGEDGRPTKVEPIFEASPGISIEPPEEHHDFGE